MDSSTFSKETEQDLPEDTKNYEFDVETVSATDSSEIDSIDDLLSDPKAEEIELVEEEELEYRRFKSQYRLKLTFERIFEKYGRDFEGVSDEIDILTGNVLLY
jgi:hypothetical protein